MRVRWRRLWVVSLVSFIAFAATPSVGIASDAALASGSARSLYVIDEIHPSNPPEGPDPGGYHPTPTNDTGGGITGTGVLIVLGVVGGLGGVYFLKARTKW